LTGARNAGMADGLQVGAQMREELEARFSELQEYVKQLEHQVSSEGDRRVTQITDSAGKKLDPEEGADMLRAESLLQWQQLMQHVLTLENRLRNAEEWHDAEIAAVRNIGRREECIQGHKEVYLDISVKSAHQVTTPSNEMT
jgi:hypothetical protein